MMSDIFPCSTPEEEVHITNSYKDITLYDIYVEDHGREDWYSVLLSAIFNCHISKSHIKALNGKRDVIKKYNELKGQLGNLFIVDADFDVLFGDADYIESNLFCWGHYNIESLLFNASAILDMIYIYRGDKYETIENNLRLKSWEETTYALLEKLFLTYACVRLMDSTRETTGISSDEYISGGQLDDKKIMDYICQIQSEFTNYDTIY